MIWEYVNAEELKRLLSSLVVFLGAIVIFLLFAFIVVPGIRNANRPRTAPSGSPRIGEMGWLDPTEIPVTRGYVIPPVDPETVLTASPGLLERGKELYTKNCTQCHGARGEGDGPASLGMTPGPRNFQESEGWKNGYQLPGIYKTLTGGIAGTSMASFDYLRKQDRMALAHYVQSLMKFPREPVDPEALEELSREIGSAGEVVPNKIPASMAMEKLEAEYRDPAPLAMPPENDRSLGAKLLRAAVTDPRRAARTLARAPAWREGIDKLSRILASGIPENGFSVSITGFTPPEWRALLSELVKLVGG